MAGHTRRWLRVLGVLIMVAAPSATPAVAHAQDQLQVSPDAQHWQADLDQPLFDPDRRWVPGDALTATFWARNTAPTPGNLRLSVDPTDQDQLLQNGLRIRVRTAESGWLPMAVDGSVRSIADNLPAGAATRVELLATFDAAAANQTQDRRTDLRVRLTLTQSIAADRPSDRPGRPSGPDQDSPAGSLAGTGLGISGLFLLVGAAATGAGVAVLRSPRRRGREHDHD